MIFCEFLIFMVEENRNETKIASFVLRLEQKSYLSHTFLKSENCFKFSGKTWQIEDRSQKGPRVFLHVLKFRDLKKSRTPPIHYVVSLFVSTN